jgi:hypothetical protein
LLPSGELLGEKGRERGTFLRKSLRGDQQERHREIVGTEFQEQMSAHKTFNIRLQSGLESFHAAYLVAPFGAMIV